MTTNRHPPALELPTRCLGQVRDLVGIEGMVCDEVLGQKGERQQTGWEYAWASNSICLVHLYQPEEHASNSTQKAVEIFLWSSNRKKPFGYLLVHRRWCWLVNRDEGEGDSFHSSVADMMWRWRWEPSQTWPFRVQIAKVCTWTREQ